MILPACPARGLPERRPGRAFWQALALWAAVAQAAGAGDLSASPRPKPRPGSTAVAITPSDLPGIRPRPRPHMAQRPAEVLQIAAGPGVTTVFASVHPPARPENLRRLSQARAVLRVPQPAPEPLTGQKGAVCGDPAIRGTALAAIPARLDGCGLEEGVRVRAVAGVALSSPVDIDCPTARALKRWVETGVEPAIGRRGGGVVALSVAASYSCRPRNNVRGARVSEHGRGRAIDISGYVLANGTAVSVLKGWGSQAHGRALSAMRRAACGPFNTVLGPGSDRYHRDHLHLDTARGRGPYCR